MKTLRRHKLIVAIAALGLTAAILAGVVGGYLAGIARATGIPTTNPLYYSGLLTDTSGKPLPSAASVVVELWDAQTAGNLKCTTTASSPTLTQGRFRVALDSTCLTAIQSNPDLWAEVVVDGTSMGRTKTGAVPYAVEAKETDPQVGANTTNYVPVWNGTALVQSSICNYANNIGIGTSNPIQKLHVIGRAILAQDGTANGSDNFDVAPNTSANVIELMASYYGSGSYPDMSLVAGGPSRVFIQASTGNVGIGTTSPAAKLHVAGAIAASDQLSARSYSTGSVQPASDSWGPADFDAAAGTTQGMYLGIVTNLGSYPVPYGTLMGFTRGASSNYEYSYQIYRGHGATDDLYFRSGRSGTSWGTWQKFSMTSMSTKRFKENFERIDRPLDKVMALHGYYFDWKKEHGGKHDVGLVAEEVQKVLPEVVENDPVDPRPKYLRYDKIVPVLVEAVKEQQRRMDSLKKELVLVKQSIRNSRHRE